MRAIEELLDEVRLLWHRMIQATQELHRQEPVSVGGRAVLEFILLQGPSTVPQIARSRLVTRQHIQALVNDLHKQGLLTLTVNPAHRRSGLAGLTAEGERVIRRMKRREVQRLERVGRAMGSAQLRRATATLRAVRSGLARGRR